MRRAAGIAALSAVLIATAADSRDHIDPLAAALAGRVAGAPVDCVEPSRLQGPEIIDARTVLYRETGARVWRAEVADACPSLRTDSILIVEVFGAQMCRNDHFRVLPRGSSIPGALCRFGHFTPYDKAPR